MCRLAILGFALAVFVTACSGPPVPTPTPTKASPAVVVVFLRDDATAAQKDAIEAELRDAPGAGPVTFETREEAYRRFKKTFSDKPELVGNTSPEDLPESFRVRFADRSDARSTLTAVRRLGGVQSASVAPTPSATATP